jgi:glycosyltransferase involved in cell wall biosynthesis
MTARPLVSVALPVFNGAGHLSAALALLRHQTYDNLEILVCDNASTDETPEICAAAAKEDDRIRYIRHPQNLGAVANFNFGLSVKRGEFFMWAAHDDEKMPRFVEVTLAALQRSPNAAMACTWTIITTAADERVHHPYSPEISSANVAERLSAFVADRQCVAFYGLYRSSVVDAIGPSDPWLDSDRRYLFKAAIRGPFEVVPEPLFRFRLTNTADDYVARGFKMRPGAADFDLDLYRHFPRLMRDAGLDETTFREARAAMMVPLRPYFDNRAEYLISRALSQKEPKSERLRSLFAWGRQYPPMMRNRMFWGAVRRVLLG